MTGCGSPVSAGKTVLIAGAWDIISPFQRQIITGYQSQSKVELQTKFSSSPIEDVRQGKSDIAILGREPPASELSGLKDITVAYDAVCMIIDTNSYNGGQYSARGTPVRKANGFQNVTTEELKAIMNNFIAPFGLRWFWGDGYYTWKPAFNPATGSYTDNSVWVPGEIAPYPSLNMIPGKYDTQTWLYQVLGSDEKAVAKARNYKYSSENLNAEEEVLSGEYLNLPPFIAGSGDFNWKIGFVSRRVIPIAIQHVPVSVVSINGINPMLDTKAVYDGSYLLSRKIHVITRQNDSPAVSDFTIYLLSQNGQQALAEAGYLPLP